MIRANRFRLSWTVALLLGMVLTVSQRVGTVRAQIGSTQSAAIDAARALLDQAVALEKANPIKDNALAADEALQRYNAAVEAGAPATAQRFGDAEIATSAAPVVVPETEPNNTSAMADVIDLTLPPRYGIVSAAIDPGGDLDFYRFTAPPGSRVWIETDTGGTANPGATSRDSVIDLLAADGATVIETDDQDGTGNGGDGTVESGSASAIGGRVLVTGGTYFIRVHDFVATGIINPYQLLVVVTTTVATAEVEANNTAASANSIVTMGSPIGLRSAAIGGAGDVDYYSVAASAGSVIYFNADADPERDGTDTDLVIEFRNSKDGLLLSVDSSFLSPSNPNPWAEGANFTIFADGEYFIKVKHFSASGVGTYDLMVVASVTSETEPNGTAATADVLHLSIVEHRCAIVSGTISPGGDVDFYFFSAAAGSRVWTETDTGGTQNPGATSRDTVIDLLAADGTTVIENDDEDGTGNGGDGTIESGLASMIGGRTLVAGGIYYIRVRAFAAVTGIINPYRLLVVLTNTTTKAEVEFNNSAASANPIVTAGVSIGLRSGSIGSAGDSDYYSVAAEAGTVVFFNADADPERDGVGTDLVVEVRSPADVLLLAVDSSATGSLANPAAEGANFTIPADGAYFIRVRHFSGTGVGTYHLMAVAATGRVLPGFTDSPLVAGVTVIKAVHFTELRSRIDALRTRFDLAPFAYSHPSLGGAVVDADDMQEMRIALQQAYVEAERSAPTFSDTPLVPQSTVIKAIHINELRAAVLELENS